MTTHASALRAKARLTMRQVDLAVGAVVFGLGLLTVYGSLSLRMTSQGAPGPGFMPRWLGISLALVGMGLIASRLASREQSEPLDLPSPRGLVRVGLALLLVLGVALTLETVGFLLAGAGMVFILLVALERGPLLQAGGMAVIVPLAFYLLFRTWLGLRLPIGLLGF